MQCYSSQVNKLYFLINFQEVPELIPTQTNNDKHVKNEALKKTSRKPNKTPNRTQNQQPYEIVSRYITTPPQLTIENAIRQITIGESTFSGHVHTKCKR